MGRWDYLYEIGPRPAIDVLLDEAARAFSDDLGRWPPPLEAVDPSLLPIIEGQRPHPLAFREAFRLARWDLERDYEAIDRWQERGWQEAQLNPSEKEAAIFLSRYLTERLFDLAEAVQSRLRRKELLELLARIEARLSVGPGPSSR
jgi:hypothetical protein